MQRMKATVAVTAFLCCVAVFSAAAKENPKTYQPGKLLDIQVQNVNRGMAVIGSIAAPIPGLLYVFQIQW
jgi:hypothetical protein